MTVVLVEHRIHEVIDVVDRIIVMDQGRIVLDGEPRRVFERSDIFDRLGLRVPDSVEFSRKMEFQQVALSLQEIAGKLNGNGWVEVEARSAQWWPGRACRPRRPVSHEPVLETLGVSFRYHKKSDPILDAVSLSVRKGETVSLMGNNGSGKSTLLLHFAGLLKPQRGRVLVCGRDIRKSSPYKLAGVVGIVFQNPTLMLFNESVRQEMEFGPRALSMDEKASARTVAEIADILEQACLRPPLSFEIGKLLNIEAFSAEELTGRVTCCR